MLVSKSSFEPRGTGSRRSTTPSHGNMRLRPSSTETWKRVLLVPPTKIMFLLFTELEVTGISEYYMRLTMYALICFLCRLFSALEKKNRKKKEELSLLSESNSPRFALSIRRRRWLLLPWRNTTTTKKRARKKREETRPRESKLPRTRTPFVRSFPPASFHSSAIFITLVLCISKRKSKRWRKELPPFHPLSSIDRSIDDSNVCLWLPRARWPRTHKKMMFYMCVCARVRKWRFVRRSSKIIPDTKNLFSEYPKPRVKRGNDDHLAFRQKKFETHSC